MYYADVNENRGKIYELHIDIDMLIRKTVGHIIYIFIHYHIAIYIF